MVNFFEKLLLGTRKLTSYKKPYLKQQLEYFSQVWNKDAHNDLGIERIVRLFLLGSQFLFLGTYIRTALYRFGPYAEKLAVEIYILFRLLFGIGILYFGLAGPWIDGLVIYFIIEIVLYLVGFFLLQDVYNPPLSYRRSTILTFINFLEVMIYYGILYSHLATFPDGAVLTGMVTPVYFSFVTATTLGYGEYYPTNEIGQILVITQLFSALLFVTILLTYYSSRINTFQTRE